MVALCGNCHPAVGNLSLKKQYAIKNQPANLKSGMVRGALVYDRPNLVFKVGGNFYENTPTIFSFYGIPIISAKIVDGEVKISIRLFNDDLFSIFEVIDNEITFRCDDLWDFKFSYNYAALISSARSTTLEMDFRKSESVIKGKFKLLGREIVLTESYTSLDTSTISNCYISGSRVGIAYGNARIIPPHYAKLNPEALIVDKWGHCRRFVRKTD